MTLDRRSFLGHGMAGLGLFSLGRLPLLGMERRRDDAPDRILVVLQLSGGNDGLSTVVPFDDDAYGRARNQTRLAKKDLLLLDDRFGLHSGLAPLHELWQQGQVAVVHGTGYPEPNRSHFKSMDIWHAANARGRSAGHGWLGRLADLGFADSTDPNLVVHVGSKLPFSVHAAVHRPVAFTTPQAYRWIGAEREVEALERAAPICEHEPGMMAEPATPAASPHRGRDLALARLRRVLHEAQDSSEKVRGSVAGFRPKARWPQNKTAASLATVAAMISGGLGTRVYSVAMGGYDTHTNQRNRHNNQMRQLGQSLGAFHQELAARGFADKVTTLVFSEFGRRVAENGNGGTDHGVAGPMFLVGKPVKGGFHGRHPSLVTLDKGDLIHTTDFRRVYGSVIDQWMQRDHRSVLGGSWQPLDLFRA